MKIVLTGGSGFLGQALAARLRASGHEVVLPLRNPAEARDAVAIRPIEQMTVADWRPILAGADAVVHAAAIAHIGPGVSYADYAAVNRDAAARLAEAAAAERLRRFVFVSSIRAQCGATSDRVQTERTKPEPTEAYGRSKLQAEGLILKALPTATILRPTLIVGPAPKGNLKTLLKLARLPAPLPFGALKAPQAMVSLDGMADAVALALAREAMAGEVYCLAEQPALSLAGIVTALRRGMRRGPGLLFLPPPLLAFPLKLLGRGDMAERLLGGLSVDSAKLAALGWKPARGLKSVLEEIGAKAS
jgi:UDP-glucose 4-epimerase